MDKEDVGNLFDEDAVKDTQENINISNTDTDNDLSKTLQETRKSLKPVEKNEQKKNNEIQLENTKNLSNRINKDVKTRQNEKKSNFNQETKEVETTESDLKISGENNVDIRKDKKIECEDIISKPVCENERENNKITRKCRYNLTERVCEDMPDEFKETATLGITDKNKAKNTVDELKKKNQAARKIQKAYRGKKSRNKFKKVVKEEKDAQKRAERKKK